MIKKFIPLEIRKKKHIIKRNLNDFIYSKTKKTLFSKTYIDINEISQYHSIINHKAHLYRDYKEPWYSIQKNKVKNLEKMIGFYNNLCIKPGETFSFWKLSENPSAKNGYLPGMTLSNGEIVKTPGGGLCQLSNAIFWTALHAGMEIIERHRHSFDVFPDSKRTVPFACGATILYNYKDLRFKNNQNYNIYINCFLDDQFLYVNLLSNFKPEFTYKIIERNHKYFEQNGIKYRYNEIYRLKFKDEKLINEELLMKNTGQCLYD